MLRNANLRFMRPLPLRPRMGQMVTFDPKVDFRPDVQVQAPINVELGGLPLSIGLFLGSGLSFLVRPQLPQGLPQNVAMILGAGLAVAGMTNLLLPKAQASAPQAAPAPAPSTVPTTTAPSAPSAPGGSVSAPPGVALSDQAVFDGISGQVTYPGEGESVNIWPWSSSYPVRVQLYNPSAASATFYLQLVANESPLPFGNDAKTTFPMQVTVGPGQTRDIDINMPISTWAWNVKYVDVALAVYKQRYSGDNPVLIAQRYLVVS